MPFQLMKRSLCPMGFFSCSHWLGSRVKFHGTALRLGDLQHSSVAGSWLSHAAHPRPYSRLSTNVARNLPAACYSIDPPVMFRRRYNKTLQSTPTLLPLTRVVGTDHSPHEATRPFVSPSLRVSPPTTTSHHYVPRGIYIEKPRLLGARTVTSLACCCAINNVYYCTYDSCVIHVRAAFHALLIFSHVSFSRGWLSLSSLILRVSHWVVAFLHG